MENQTSVVVRDVQMPFLSMVGFMIKWSLATVPAMVILIWIGMMAWGLLLAITGKAG